MTKTLQEIQEENRKLILETIYACSYEEALEREMKIPFCQVKHKKAQDLDSIRHFNSPDDIELVDYLTSFFLDDLKIIGLPLTLSRVLLALSKQDWWRFPFYNAEDIRRYPLVLGFDGAFCEVCRIDFDAHLSEKFRWNLTKETLEEQTGETQREINKLLTALLTLNNQSKLK